MADTGTVPPTAPAGDRMRSDGQRARGRGPRSSGRGRGKGGDGAASHRGGGHRGRGRGGHHAGGDQDGHQQAPTPPLATPATKSNLTQPKRESGEQGPEQDGDDDAEGEVCFICANPIQHHAVAPCNHVTCHICALRMRALYKNKDCPHCRTPAPFVIFTDDPSKQFQEYTSADVSSADNNIGIRYTNEDIVGDTVLLLRYNCPDGGCDFAGLGWPDLHRHVRQTHHKKMCDLCTRNKKVFTHEHELFTDKNLHKHMAHGDDRPGDIAQTGFRGHPLCGFCGERFYDDDKLYEHCRNKHERCFICDRRDSRSPHYYLNYDKLEEHFKNDHYLCLDRECLEKKFVVFESEMDLKAHQLSEHGNSLSKDVRRDARMVDISGFDFRQPYQEERRGGRSGAGGRGGREGREGRGRGRDPNAEPLPRTSAQPLSRAEIALQRMAAQEGPRAIHSAQSISNRTFGGQLTTTANSAGPTPAVRSNGAGVGASGSASSQTTAPLADSFASLSVTEQANLSPQDRARLVRHGAVIERASNLLGNDQTKMDTFRSQISSYKAGSVTGSQLIDAFFALFADTSSGALGTLVREVADLFEDKNKADALHKAWHDWRAINEDYPSLPGLGGMHGATTSSSGWASAASAGPTLHRPSGGAPANREKLNTRVLKLKNSTRRGSAAGVPGSEPAGPAATAVASSVQWTNVPSSSRGATALASSTAFPALPSSKDTAGKTKGSTPFWIGGGGGGGASAAASTSSTSTPRTTTLSAPVRKSAGSGSGAVVPPSKNQDAFPSLPAAPKVHTSIFTPGLRGRPVRSDFGVKKETGFSWGGGAGGDGEGASSGLDGNVGGDAGEQGEVEGPSGGKGKGKKKKGKQVLAAWG